VSNFPVLRVRVWWVRA